MGISLQAPSGCARSADAIVDIALKSGCPNAIAQRVRTCIMHSGRYDCRIAAGAAFYLVTHVEMFEVFGGSVKITDRKAA